jgi:hypothetical protein
VCCASDDNGDDDYEDGVGDVDERDRKSLLIASFTSVHPAVQAHISRGERDARIVCYTNVRTDSKLRFALIQMCFYDESDDGNDDDTEVHSRAFS